MAVDQIGTALVQAVKIGGSGESVPPKEGYSTYAIPSDHEVFETGTLSPVSVLIGMPLVVTRFRPSILRKTYARTHLPVQYSRKTIDDFYDNTTAGKLMICAIEGARSLPFATPPEWQAKVGTVLVARADKTPLYPHHIKVMLDFMAKAGCYDQQHPTTAMQTPDSAIAKKDIIEILTPAAFRAYYMERRAAWHFKARDSKEACWSWEPSPFIEAEAEVSRVSDEDKSDSGEEDFEAGRCLLEAGDMVLPCADLKGALRLRRGLGALRLGDPKPEKEESKEDMKPDEDAG